MQFTPDSPKCHHMASRTTPKGCVHLKGVMPHGQHDDSQGSYTPLIVVGTDLVGEGEPPHGTSSDFKGRVHLQMLLPTGGAPRPLGVTKLGSIHRPITWTSDALTTELNRLALRSASPVTSQGGGRVALSSHPALTILCHTLGIIMV